LSVRNRASSLRLIGRVYWPRIIGLAIATVAISVSLMDSHSPLWFWILLFSFGFLWPHLANYVAKKSSNPFRTEKINLYIDAFFMGFWVPFISFNFVPSIAILGMHLLSIISVLGFRMTVLGFVIECLGIAVSVAIVGLNVNLDSNFLSILISLPMLTFYPLLVGNMSYQLSYKLTAKKAQLEQLSRTDALTGLNNRMYLDEQLEQLFKLNKREKSKACFIFIDVDHFKAINDQFGHIVGDEVLQKIAGLIKQNVREVDICGRYGGEEFCILMPNTLLAEAEKMSERIRLHIERSVLHQEHNITGSISLGIAEISDAMVNYNDWLTLADQAQYKAKKQGRNRTVVASPK